MRLLPPSNIPPRALTLSIDLPASSLAGSRAVKNVRAKILSILRQYNVPATLGLNRVAEVQLVRQLTADEIGHEIALLGDAMWAGPAAGRTRLRIELRRRIELLAATGCQVTTMVARGVALEANLDVLVRYGIKMVASDRDAASLVGKSAAVRTLRYGLWEVPATNVLSGNTSWRSGLGDVRKMRRQVDRTIVADSLMHIALDGACILQSSAAARDLERLLRHVDQRRAQGSLQVLTLKEVGQVLSQSRSQPAARSILRGSVESHRAA